MQGTRAPDNEFLHILAELGDHRGLYGKEGVENGLGDGWDQWYVCAPDGAVFVLCNEFFRDSKGKYHEVEEHEDGTISVVRRPENSNSIMSPKGWHGYIDHGTWRPV